ncbi:MAG TPA: SLC13 family permease [Caulobacteraceae bacterium]|jgi:di/tricarboxylate transporter|nr:SLC13 family permease [Caulobacteraceae bacterium]
MTLKEGLAFAILGGAMLCFAWGRFRYDIVALVALLVAVLAGVVPAAKAFSGFTSDVVVIIACALIISAAVAQSGLMEHLLQPVLSRLKTLATQVPVMAGATALLSMPTKNVGALAILIPVATKLARDTKTSRSAMLMPMSFMSLLGGLVTLVGTSTNIIVSQVREEATGHPFQMFDFAPVGLTLTLAGLIFVSFGWRLLPRNRQGPDVADALAVAYTTEALVPEDWPSSITTLGELKLRDDGVRAIALLRESKRVDSPRGNHKLLPGDTLVLEGTQDRLAQIFSRTRLVHVSADDKPVKQVKSEEVRTIEAVVQRDSVLIGRSAARVQLREQFGVNLMAVSRSGERITQRLRDVTLRAGDVLVLEAGERSLSGALQSLGALALVERQVKLAGVSRRWLPLAILGVAMTLVALQVVTVAVAFFGAALLVVLSGAITMREAYNSLEGQVLILIGALTPLSEAVRATGGTELIAGGLATLAHGLPPLLTLGAMMVIAMACSPFLHNAPTVLVLGPIAVALASRLHLSLDAFLMAVATGAGSDFLTPVGHQCNTLVMGPGGYRFWDYPRLGAPLSLLVILLGVPVIALVWGL